MISDFEYFSTLNDNSLVLCEASQEVKKQSSDNESNSLVLAFHRVGRAGFYRWDTLLSALSLSDDNPFSRHDKMRQLVFINLAGTTISQDNLKLLFSALESLPCLRTLDISYSKKEISHVPISLTQAQSTVKSEYSPQQHALLDFKIGDMVVPFISQLILRSHSIKRILCAGNGITPEGLFILIQTAIDNHFPSINLSSSSRLIQARACSLVSLDLQWNDIKDELALLLFQHFSSSLFSVNLAGNNITADAIFTCFLYICHPLSAIEDIDLSFNAFPTDIGQIKVITDRISSACVRPRNPLRIIKLSHVNSLQVWKIAHCLLVKKCSISSLDLSDNDICAQSADSILNIVSQNSSLNHLNLSNNPLGDKGVLLLCKHLRNTKLREIELNSCNIGDIGATAIANIIIANHFLKKVYLVGNLSCQEGSISKKGFDILNAAAKERNKNRKECTLVFGSPTFLE